MRTQQGQALFWICLTGILNKETGEKKINKPPTLILIPHLNIRRDHRRGAHIGREDLWGAEPEHCCREQRPQALQPEPSRTQRAASVWKLPEIQGLQEMYDQHLQRDRTSSFQNH